MVNGRWTSAFLTFCFLPALRAEHRNGVISIAVKEGDDIILPCSLSTNENIAQQLFDWKKDGQKEVFMYDAGVHYNKGCQDGQDEQFKGRVSHFPQQLKFGNASIIINNTKMTDSGNYTCDFPRLQPERQIFEIELIVGAAPRPDIDILNATEDGVLLQCAVLGAFPKPTVQWTDSDGNDLHADEPQVTYRVDRYYITLHTTVTKTTTNRFYCVVTQEDIAHKIQRDIYVPFYDKTVEDKPCQSAGMFIGVWFSGVLTVGVPLALFLITKYIRKRSQRGSNRNRNGSCNGAAEWSLTVT